MNALEDKIFATAFKGVVLFFCFVACLLFRDEFGSGVTRGGSPLLIRVKDHADRDSRHSAIQSNLPDWGADTWCAPQPLPGLPYMLCDAERSLAIIPAYQGNLLTTFRTILLATIQSFQENQCLVVDDASMFLQGYFEPIGCAPDHPSIQQLLKSQNVRVYSNHDFETQQNVFNANMSIPSLGYHNVEAHFLRKILLRRIFRLLPERRYEMCSDLASLNLGKDFITLAIAPSIHYIRLRQYLDAAKEAAQHRFNGIVPPIYVVTNDCAVLKHFQDLEPAWRFVSECDRHPDPQIGGFWSGVKTGEAESSAHYHKFLVDLLAVATSTYYIGVGASEISWFAFFMRGTRHSFRLLDGFDAPDSEIFNQW